MKQKTKWWYSIGNYALLYMSLVLLYIFGQKLQIINNIQSIQKVMLFSLFVCATVAMYTTEHVKEHSKKYETYLILLLVAGCVMRIGYTMYTPWYERTHDMGEISIAGNGHGAYIVWLFQGMLPSSNDYQFYHPPFFHICAAATMRVVGLLTRETNAQELFDATKLVSLFASCGILLQIKKLLKDMELSAKSSCLALAVVAFFPNLLYMSGRINNDCLVVFFMIVAMRYTFLWYKERSYKNIIILAISYGLGMMTKTSCFMMAVFTGVVMLLVLVKSWKEKKWGSISFQFLVFACVALPLGLWYPIRNMIRFQQPFAYVYDLGENHPVYCGNHNNWERFGFSLRYYENLWNSPVDDYNLPSYLLKSAMFGEFGFNISNTLGSTLLFCGILLAVFSLLGMLWLVCKRNNNKLYLYGLFFVWFSQMISYLSFNLQYPFACTMDFRYITPTAIVGGIFLGICHCEWEKIEKQKIRLLNTILVVLVMQFVLLSVSMFCFMN